jgi:glutamate--cysteine ligase
MCGDARRFLIIPENHTRNLFYLQNVAALADIIRKTGLTVRFGSLIPDLQEPLTLDLPDGGQLTLEPVRREGNRLLLDPGSKHRALRPLFDPAQQRPFCRCPGNPAGPRSEADHAAAAARRLGDAAQIQPFQRLRSGCARVFCADRHRPVADQPVSRQLRRGELPGTGGRRMPGRACGGSTQPKRAKYVEYGIDREPFVIVKADAGTYGMGIMTVKSADDVRDLNRKQRNKMAVVKEGLEVTQVLVQEGVPTFESINEAVAEPVVYMIDHFVVGGFYRVHTSRGIDENLNAPGMHFVPLAFDQIGSFCDCGLRPDAPVNRFYTYGVLARLAALASALELEQTEPKAVNLLFIADPWRPSRPTRIPPTP